MDAILTTEEFLLNFLAPRINFCFKFLSMVTKDILLAEGAPIYSAYCPNFLKH